MSIQTVKTTINGVEHILTYNSETGKWEASIPAPTGSSFNQPGGKYDVSLTATNEAGTSATIDSSDDEFGSVLALQVIEKQAPVITITSPGAGAFITTATPTVKFKVLDNTIGNGGDSGIDLSSLVVKVDGTAVEEISSTAIDGGYECECALSALSEGSHTVTIDGSDNDGNAATQASVTFEVDTVPPALDITAPSDGLIVNSSNITIVGTTDSTATVKITLNDAYIGEAIIDSDGNFEMELTLDVGENIISVSATDSAGLETVVERTIVLDISVPVFKSVSLTPNPVDAGATLILAVEVE